MIYGCRTNPLSYVKIPKAGCTTILNVMYFLDEGVFPDDLYVVHTDPSILQHLEGNRVQFTFIRNPIDRLWSCFVDKIHASHPQSMPWLRPILSEQYGMTFEESEEQVRDDFRKFVEFVRLNLKYLNDAPRDLHWVPQSEIIGANALDFIGVVEDLENGFYSLLANLGITKIKIPHLNRSASIIQLLDKEIEDKIKEIYQSDIDLYDAMTLNK